MTEKDNINSSTIITPILCLANKRGLDNITLLPFPSLNYLQLSYEKGEIKKMDTTALSLLPIAVILFLYLIPFVLIIFAVVYFLKLMKEKNHILREIAQKLDKLDR